LQHESFDPLRSHVPLTSQVNGDHRSSWRTNPNNPIGNTCLLQGLTKRPAETGCRKALRAKPFDFLYTACGVFHQHHALANLVELFVKLLCRYFTPRRRISFKTCARPWVEVVVPSTSKSF